MIEGGSAGHFRFTPQRAGENIRHKNNMYLESHSDPSKMVGHYPKSWGHGPIFDSGQKETPGTLQKKTTTRFSVPTAWPPHLENHRLENTGPRNRWGDFTTPAMAAKTRLGVGSAPYQKIEREPKHPKKNMPTLQVRRSTHAIHKKSPLKHDGNIRPRWCD